MTHKLRSTAVMARRAEPHTSLDFFPTPLWATRALVEHVVPCVGPAAWDPACGDGAMVRVLLDYAAIVHASDVHDYNCGFEAHDFLQPYLPRWLHSPPEWIITNPPFRLAEQFIERGLAVATRGVAMLVRTSFIEGQGRYARLYRDTPPAVVAQFTERVSMFRGRLAPGSTATAYCWLVWETHRPTRDTRLVWIPPCRDKLERPGDYPATTKGTVSHETSQLFEGGTG